MSPQPPRDRKSGEERRHRVIEMSRAGVSVNEQAKILGISNRTVSVIRMKAGLTNALPLDSDSVEKRRERVVEMTRAGMSAADIAAELKVTERTVTRMRRVTGIAQPPAVPFTPEELARAEQLLLDGTSIDEAARSIGRPSSGGIRRHFGQYAWTQQQTTEFANLCRRMRRCG